MARIAGASGRPRLRVSHSLIARGFAVQAGLHDPARRGFTGQAGIHIGPLVAILVLAWDESPYLLVYRGAINNSRRLFAAVLSESRMSGRPLRGAFVGAGDTVHGGFIAGFADDLHGKRQAG